MPPLMADNNHLPEAEALRELAKVWDMQDGIHARK